MPEGGLQPLGLDHPLLAMGLGRRPVVGCPGVGADPLRRDHYYRRARRRGPPADPVQPADRGPLHGRAGHRGLVFFILHRRRRTRSLKDGRQPTTSSRSSASSGPGRSTTSSDNRRSTAQTTSRPPGHPADIPTLCLPVDESVEFNLQSPDVIHSFWVPRSSIKMDVIPGRVQQLHVTPTARRRLRGQVRRAVRRLPLAHAVQRQGRHRRRSTPHHLKDLKDEGNTGLSLLRRLARRLHPGRPGLESTKESAAVSHRDRIDPARPRASDRRTPKQLGQQVVRVLTTTDHKLIGKLYLVTSFALFLVGGLMAHDHALRARLPGPADRQRRALQPAVHDARHDHAAAVRDAAVLRLRQRDHAAADRLARRGVPAAEHVQLLALPVRRPHRRLRLPDPAGAADFGWSAYTPLSDAVRSPGRRR